MGIYRRKVYKGSVFSKRVPCLLLLAIFEAFGLENIKYPKQDEKA